MTIENSVSLGGFGLGGKIGQKQDIDGDSRSSNFVQFVESGGDVGGLSSKTITEFVPGEAPVKRKENSFSIGAKYFLGLELKVTVGQ